MMRLGIIGCGQLARMLAMAARRMDVRCSFVALDGEDSRCVEGLGDIVQWHEGATDVPELYFSLGTPDVITVEREEVSVDLLRALAEYCAVYPDPEAVSQCQHRLRERELLAALAIPVAPYAAARHVSEVERAVRELGLPVVIKQARSGYDGKNQWRIRSEGDLARFLSGRREGEWLVERWVPFERELSVIAARSASGEMAAYPVTQNWHRDGILHSSLAPARELTREQERLALQYMQTLLQGMKYVGVLAMECFVEGERVLVNELAPRVHNSGHWTQEGGVASQFENHLRAIFGLTLGKTVPDGYVGMVNILGQRPAPACYTALTGNATLHWYDKEPRPGRKLGHLLVTGAEWDDVRLRLAWVQAALAVDQSERAGEAVNEFFPCGLSVPPDTGPVHRSQHGI